MRSSPVPSRWFHQDRVPVERDARLVEGGHEEEVAMETKAPRTRFRDEEMKL